jgi:hypothetical protein
MPIEVAIPKLDMATGRIHETPDIGAPIAESQLPASDGRATTRPRRRLVD